FFNSYLFCFPVLFYQGGFWGEFGQSSNRFAGFVHREMFECMAHAEQEQQQSAFGPFAQYSCSDGCNKHKKVNFKTALGNGLYCFFGRVETTKEISSDIQRQANPRGDCIHEREAKTYGEQ